MEVLGSALGTLQGGLMSDAVVRAATQLVVRGARTHNLKDADVSLPIGSLTIVTGVSGSGKSSLAFDTIYAEGQRRYVESLSAYARQFLERMEKPDVDRIEGICPAIAIRQKNSIRNPRSTVGTTTEIHDYMRLLWARVGHTFCRQCGNEVSRETAEVVARRLAALPEGTRLLVGFEMPVVSVPDTPAPADLEDGETVDAPVGTGGRTDPLSETLKSLIKRGFRRLLVDGHAVTLEEVNVASLGSRATLDVVVDRVVVDGEAQARLTDSIETAYREGGGAAFAVELARSETGAPVVHQFSERFECRRCHIQYEDPQPRLFSFNNPFGACPTCHGFGNVIELDLDLVVPDKTKSIRGGAIEPWTKPHYRAELATLKRDAKHLGIGLDTPWQDLTDEQRRVVVEGDGGDYAGIRGFFAWLERKKYKVHVRVFLSRYRGYLTCPACGGTRLRQEARDVQVSGKTIDRASAMTVSEAQQFFGTLALGEQDAAIADKVLREIVKRLRFLGDVGLDYLTLDRLSSTLSGGESQRINLATSLGSALVDTLYVLDEPSIGLHPRDNLRLIAILRQLRDQGNTVLVVEHDADMIAVADYIVDLGLGAGEHGGRVIYEGSLEGLKRRHPVVDREVPARGADHPGARAAAPWDRPAGARHRGHRAQPEEHRRLVPARRADVRHRCQRIRQIHAGARRDLRRDPARQGRGAVGDAPRRIPRARRDRAHLGRRPGGPDAHRAHAAQQRRHLPEGLRSNPRAVCLDQGRAQPGPVAEPLLVQRARRPLRGL